MMLNNDSYNYRLPKLTLKRFNHTRQYSILINKLAAAKQLYSLEWNAVFNMTWRSRIIHSTEPGPGPGSIIIRWKKNILIFTHLFHVPEH